MKTTPDATKLRGGYYTPNAVAQWMTDWGVQPDTQSVLEPSCGDGVFVTAALESARRLKTRTRKRLSVTGVELVATEARKAEQATQHTLGANAVEIIHGDFFQWLKSQPARQYDLVVGNPPFIRYQHFPEPARSAAMTLMQTYGLAPNRLTNIWVPFVVGGVGCLRPGGRLAMVLPAELLQVTYAGQLRQFLADSFEQLTIHTCNEMFFPRAEQEVVLLLAEGCRQSESDIRSRCDIALLEADRVKSLLSARACTQRKGRTRKLVEHDSEKWLKYFLSARDISLMRSLRGHAHIAPLSAHATVDVGVVTGKNEFFVLSAEEVATHGLRDFVVPLVGRSAHMAGTILRRSDHLRLGTSGKRVFLLHIDSSAAKRLPRGLRAFIAAGERAGFHTGYKCSIREPWYKVPAVWTPDCFFFRQIYDFPRVVVNKAGATSTDTIHRMRCKPAPSTLAAHLYTHLTAASAEIEGRSYGGGVLELEPTEAERLLVPKELSGAMPLTEADKLVRQGRLELLLEQNDRLVLQDTLGLSESECKALRDIWQKMRNRRLGRRKN
jgi:adenine-specific DNA methylase